MNKTIFFFFIPFISHSDGNKKIIRLSSRNYVTTRVVCRRRRRKTSGVTQQNGQHSSPVHEDIVGEEPSMTSGGKEGGVRLILKRKISNA